MLGRSCQHHVGRSGLLLGVEVGFAGLGWEFSVEQLVGLALKCVRLGLAEVEDELFGG